MASDDLRARIAEVSRDHFPVIANKDRTVTCRCGTVVKADRERQAIREHRADAVLAVVQPEIDALLDLLADLVDSSPCRLDGRGWCEAHSWFWTMPCPHGRARALLKVEEVESRGE